MAQRFPRMTVVWRAARRLASRVPVLRAIGRFLAAWSNFGVAGYPPEDRRRLKILNMFALLVVVSTGAYAVQNMFMDAERFRPVIVINTGMLLVAACLPLLHRFGPIAAGLTLVLAEYVVLFALSAYLGRDAGLHLQYFIAAAVTFVVLGAERLRLSLAITAVGLALHLMVWFMFPPDHALIPADDDLLRSLYVQAAVTTMALITATVWYAFTLVEEARGETEALLRNILPGSIVERLKAKPDEPIADTFEDVSVLFADISGFVAISRRIGARAVVEMLNRLMREFDTVAARHGVEKIKTIGDAYMAAAGLPEHTPDHAIRLVAAAFDMLSAVERLRAETGLEVRMRIGVASGPVMAGVIGRNKFTYDVWGDTVNLAARLESVGTPGRILVCPDCRTRILHRFACDEMVIVPIKGIGSSEAWIVSAIEPAENHRRTGIEPTPAEPPSARPARS